jgi:hypothetical protein
MPDEHKTLEQRIADIEFNLKKLRGPFQKKAAEKIGRPDLRPHVIRHRRLTRLCSSLLGTNPLLVLSFAGQSSLSSLPFYYRVSLEEKRRLLTVK